VHQVTDDSTQHDLSDQNGGSDRLPGNAIGHARLDLSLATSASRYPAAATFGVGGTLTASLP